jgi:hypothetical protein
MPLTLARGYLGVTVSSKFVSPLRGSSISTVPSASALGYRCFALIEGWYLLKVTSSNS